MIDSLKFEIYNNIKFVDGLGYLMNLINSFFKDIIALLVFFDSF